jgi:hypothetical protein
MELYCRRALGPAERRKLDAHLDACAECLGRVSGPAYSGMAFDALAEALLPPAGEAPFHLSRAELQRYFDGSADEADRIIAESHLETCAQCGDGAPALSAPDADGAAASAEAARVRPAPAPSRERLAALRGFVASSSPAARTAALVVVLLGGVLLAGLLFRREGRPDEGQEQAAQGGAGAAETRPGDETAARPADERGAGAGDEEDRAGALPESGEADGTTGIRLKDNGREVGINARGELDGLGGLAPPARRAVIDALSGEKLQRPRVLEELSAPPITLMGERGGEPSFRLRGPRGVVVTTSRPTLRWGPLAGASGYTVSVFDAEFNRVAKSAPQAGTVWRVSAPLAHGRLYSWEVTALRDGREITSPVAPAPRAQFKILEAEAVRELASLERRRPRSRLALGVTYARFGLLAEAEREFQTLSKENPRSPLARNLLRIVRSWRAH